MQLKHLLIINAVVALAYGIVFVLSPATMLSLHGLGQDPGERLMTQYFGSALVAVGLLSWLARNVADAEAQRAIILALLISDTVGTIISVLGTLGGPMNAVGWSAAAVYLVLTLGFGYFQFGKQGASQAM